MTYSVYCVEWDVKLYYLFIYLFNTPDGSKQWNNNEHKPNHTILYRRHPITTITCVHVEQVSKPDCPGKGPQTVVAVMFHTTTSGVVSSGRYREIPRYLSANRGTLHLTNDDTYITSANNAAMAATASGGRQPWMNEWQTRTMHLQGRQFHQHINT